MNLPFRASAPVRSLNALVSSALAASLAACSAGVIEDDLTDPSSNHETRNAVGATGGPFDSIQGNLSLNATTILTGASVGDTFVFGGGIVAFTPNDKFRMQLGGQLPIAGERRFEWKATADVYLFL